MRSSLVVTFTGLDRAGIVDDMARIVAEHDGNWEQAHMARLAGRFAGILHVTAEREAADQLVVALRSLESAGLAVLIERGTPDELPAGRSVHLRLSGHDRPGIVREVAGALASRGLNIQTLETDCAEAPMVGGLIFSATALLHAPSDVRLDELARVMEDLADQLGVDLNLSW